MKNLFKKSSAISIATAMLASMTLSPLASFAESGVDGPYSIQVNPYYGTSSGVPGDGYTPPGEGTSPDTATRTFIIEAVDSTGTLIPNGYTNKLSGTGSILFDKLDEGYYKIYPEYTGDAASLTGINSFIVQLPMTNSTGGTLKPVNVYPKDLFPDDENVTDPNKPPVVNPPVDPDDPTTDFDSSVTLNKVKKGTTAPITGAKFKLYYDNDGNYMPVGGGKEYESNGDDGDIVITDLPYGTYYFIETEAASGYLLEQTPVKFEITAAVPHVEIIKENEAAPTVTKVFDRVEGGNYYWTITANVPSNPSSLLTYTISDIMGAGLDTISIESVKYGNTSLSNIVPDGAPEGTKADYTVSGNVITINPDFFDNKTTAEAITVVVKSTIDPETAIDSVTNNASISYTYDPYIPGDGTVDPDVIAPNDPDITPSPNPGGTDETENNDDNTVEVQQVIVNVVDGSGTTIDPATGATFNIVDLTDPNNPIVIVEGVTPGTEVILPVGGKYTLVQTKAPDGYKYSDAKVEFTVAADDPGTTTDDTQIVNFTNTKSAFDLPFTGTISTIIFFAGGICLMAIAGLFIFIIIKKKKEEEEEEQTN